MIVTIYSLVYTALVVLLVTGRKEAHTTQDYIFSNNRSSEEAEITQEAASRPSLESTSTLKTTINNGNLQYNISTRTYESMGMQRNYTSPKIRQDLRTSFKFSARPTTFLEKKTTRKTPLSVDMTSEFGDEISASRQTFVTEDRRVKRERVGSLYQTTKSNVENVGLQTGNSLLFSANKSANFTPSLYVYTSENISSENQVRYAVNPSERMNISSRNSVKSGHGFNIYLNKSESMDFQQLKNLRPSSETNTNSENKTRQLMEPLIRQDNELNKTLALAWNYMKCFLSSGDLEFGQKAINLTEYYIERRQDWIRYIKLFSNTKNNLPVVILADGSLLNVRDTEMNVVRNILQKFETIYRLAKTMNDTNEIKFRTYYDNYTDISGGTLFGQNETNMKELKIAVEDLEIMWNEYNIQRYSAISLNNSNDPVCENENLLDIMTEILRDGDITTQNPTNKSNDLTTLKQQELEMLFRYYVYPGVYIVFLVLGVIGNGTLLLMFAKYKEVRTAPNIMVFNLAIADVMNLFANAPLYYVSKYHSEWIFFDGYGCRIFVTFRFLNHAVIELSIVALSAQRYCATVSALRTSGARWRLNARIRTVIFIFTVWLIGLILALPPSIIFDFRNGVCFPFVKSQVLVKALDIFYFVFFCFVLPILMALFSLMTAHRLRKSVREIPGEVRIGVRELARYRSAKVVTALAIAYAVSHIPRSIWFFLVSYFHLSRRAMKYIFIDEVTNYLMFSNSCLNPLALYIASGTFRRLFKRHLCCVRKSVVSRPPPMERRITSSSSARLVVSMETCSTDISNHQMSIKEKTISRTNSDFHVNTNPSI
ncbi:uncharacterized protein [Periplaneta americana]|uniref:uncharacterized protein n=1 Tax=Periplaneta americana TaxID=6978 RepID=UPI0037E92D02